jgi:hypothetical protein
MKREIRIKNIRTVVDDGNTHVYVGLLPIRELISLDVRKDVYELDGSPKVGNLRDSRLKVSRTTNEPSSDVHLGIYETLNDPMALLPALHSGVSISCESIKLGGNSTHMITDALLMDGAQTKAVVEYFFNCRPSTADLDQNVLVTVVASESPAVQYNAAVARNTRIPVKGSSVDVSSGKLDPILKQLEDQHLVLSTEWQRGDITVEKVCAWGWMYNTEETKERKIANFAVAGANKHRTRVLADDMVDAVADTLEVVIPLARELKDGLIRSRLPVPDAPEDKKVEDMLLMPFLYAYGLTGTTEFSKGLNRTVTAIIKRNTSGTQVPKDIAGCQHIYYMLLAELT